MHIAFIGLGNMGGPMALNLQKAGHEVHAFDLSASACDKFAAEGLKIAQDATAAVQGSGLEVERFNAIAQVVSQDDYLQAKAQLIGARAEKGVSQ